MATAQQADEAAPMNDLTGFQRDILYALAGLDGGPKGTEIRDRLDDAAYGRMNNGRFYQNLRTLRDDGYVDQERVDGNMRAKTNTLTDKAREALRDDLDWRVGCIDDE